MPTARKNVINANIILYGPKNAGKSTNLQYIFRKVKQNQRGQIVPMTQEGYPHVSYEFLPMELGELNGYDTNLYIYTAPAHVDGSETRHNLLNEAAGVVFIVDSSLERLDDNIEALTMLKEELRFWDIDYDTFPIVFQYNHRDAPDALPIDDLETQLNPEGKPFYEAEAAGGEGVRDTFARICKMAVKKVRSKLVYEELESSTKANARNSSGLSVEPSAPTLRPSTSEHTLNEAPPMRLGDYAESNQTGDELVVDDSDRPGSDQISKTDAVTDAGHRIASDAPAKDPHANLSQRTSIESVSEKLDPQEDERSGGVDDFLKTSMLFGGDSTPEDMGMMEAGDAEVVEGAAEEDDTDEDSSPVMASPASLLEPLGKISLQESAPITAALSLSSLDSDELNIQTVTEDEDEDDFQPVIMLGARARAAEEAEIEDEMMLDEEPILEDESAFHADDAHEDAEAAEAGDAEMPGDDDAEPLAALSSPHAPDVEDLSDDDAVFQQTTVEQPLTDIDVSPLPDSSSSPLDAMAAGEDEEDEIESEAERSIIASDADLLAAGFSQDEARQILNTRMPEGISEALDAPITHVVEDEEEVFESHRLIVDGAHDLVTPSEGPTEPSRTSSSPSTEEAPEGQALPDLAIAPLEEESVGSPEELGMVQEAGADVFELASEQAVEEDSPFEMLQEASVFDSGHDELQETNPPEAFAASSAVAQALSERLFVSEATPGQTVKPVLEPVVEPTAEPAVELARTSAPSSMQITRWGEVTRVDDKTLLLPVTVTLAGQNQPIELAITLQVDRLLEPMLRR